MLTPVYSTETAELVAEYSLPAPEAVVAAWEQHHRNMNTWEYAKKMEQDYYPLEEGKYGWSLGNFWAPKQKFVKEMKRKTKNKIARKSRRTNKLNRRK